MRYLFDIERTVTTYGEYFSQHTGLLRELLRSLARCMDRVLPPDVARQIDQEGSVLVQQGDGIVVQRHPRLEAARCELARMDLFRLFLPQRYGGLDLPVGIYYLAVQLISYYDASLALVFLVHGNAMFVIERYGDESQKLRYLPSLAAGEQLATVAFSEPQAGSDAGGIRTTAVREGAHYVLNGSKTWITHGGDADVLVTTARTLPAEAGIKGVSTFILEREADGVELVGLEEKTGLSGSPTAELRYTDLHIPLQRLLGAEGQGGTVMFAGVGMTRVNIGAQALGIAKRAFDAAASFALERRQGGDLIVEYDAIQQRFVEMAFPISVMESLICRLASLEDQRQWHVREMAITKYFCSEALQELTQRAINVFGGYGVSRDFVVERCRREAVALPLFGGTSEIQWIIISRELINALSGTAHCDYRARDEETIARLGERCGEEYEPLLRRLDRARAKLWRLVAEVAELSDPVPYFRHLADLSAALAAAEVLLWRATATDADEIDHELCLLAFDRLEDRVSVTHDRITRRVARGALKQALRRRLVV